MAEKTIHNNTVESIQVTLFLREGDSPFSYAEEKITVDLNPGTKVVVKIGDNENALLNGISLLTLSSADFYNKVQFISSTQSELETLLNGHSKLTITKEKTDYIINGEE